MIEQVHRPQMPLLIRVPSALIRDSNDRYGSAVLIHSSIDILNSTLHPRLFQRSNRRAFPITNKSESAIAAAQNTGDIQPDAASGITAVL